MVVCATENLGGLARVRQATRGCVCGFAFSACVLSACTRIADFGDTDN
jgi:hypothetical protein